MNYFFSIPAIVFLPVLFMACGHNDHDGHNHAHEEDISDVSDLKHEKHEDGIIVMSPDDAQFLGVHTDTVKYGTFGDVLHVSGELETSPTEVFTAVSPSAGTISLTSALKPGSCVSAGTVLAMVSAKNMVGGDANESAYIALETAKRELERLKPLHADGIVSTRDYNAAEAEYSRALAAYSGAKSGGKISSKISGVVTDILIKDGEYVESGAPIAIISKNEKLTVRADIPVRYIDTVKDKVAGNLRFAGRDNVFSLEELNARRLSDRAVSMNGAFVPVFFEIDNRGGNLVAGMAADIYLQGNAKDGVISVPVEAVSEQQGVYFVYVKLDDDCYRKVPVVLGQSDGCRVEIKSGITDGTEVVTSGMIFVKLAESNGAVPEGHTHNH